ncbi:arsenate reductase (glutaredoxin) [Elizabethkingia argentiflava]|uniref:Arsenate reductase (Glutaredoxin) n=1 Tax=Elizabethkingia argenteiflava TaxID=2681556 RepID=A0A845PU46_9FLAO|nr:arsenate reductase (glutaredoxin) [Elizabethkingia argenteiflava]NAW50551.1 arsenate reductase (glutaredoxin) [Elizabethkingia argenteiflava]
MKVKIYHNSRCYKSREALQYLEDQGIAFELVNLIQTPLDEFQIKQLLEYLKFKPEELVRTGDALFKEKYADKPLDDQAWLKILVDHPNLIHRPIVLKDDQAIIARPLEKLKDWLNN